MYRSAIFKEKHMIGARSLLKAGGDYEQDKPIIAIVNSFTEFVPGHTHLNKVGRVVKAEIEKLGCVAREMNTIAVDDGIAMGHDGMLYSLPSRDIIADSVEYMANAHKVDGLICISNCDKITPGMLMATMRLNIPTVMVSGGPMEAGKFDGKKADLVTAIVAGSNDKMSEKELKEVEDTSCPTCGSCAGMFTANSMNSLAEAMGMALPMNGSMLATHKNRKEMFIEASKTIVDITRKYYEKGEDRYLPRNIVTKKTFENAMSVDIAMGGSTNTILHILAIAREAEVDFTLDDIGKLSKVTPTLCKVSPSSDYHMEDVHRAGGIISIMKELVDMGLIDTTTNHIFGKSIGEVIKEYDITISDKYHKLYKSAPCGVKNLEGYSQDNYYKSLDIDRANGCIRDKEHAYSKDGGLAVLYGNLATEGAIIKTAGVDKSMMSFKGKAVVCESQDEAVGKILANKVQKGDVVVIRYEGPKGGPGMQEMLYPTSFLKSVGLDKYCALITDGRFSGGSAGLSVGHISKEAAEGGNIALIEDGDTICIDIEKRVLELEVDENTLAKRREAIKEFKPKKRDRKITKALKRYSHLVTNASKGAILE